MQIKLNLKFVEALNSISNDWEANLRSTTLTQDRSIWKVVTGHLLIPQYIVQSHWEHLLKGFCKKVMSELKTDRSETQRPIKVFLIGRYCKAKYVHGYLRNFTLSNYRSDIHLTVPHAADTYAVRKSIFTVPQKLKNNFFLDRLLKLYCRGIRQHATTLVPKPEELPSAALLEISSESECETSL